MSVSKKTTFKLIHANFNKCPQITKQQPTFNLKQAFFYYLKVQKIHLFNKILHNTTGKTFQGAGIAPRKKSINHYQ